MHPDRIVTISNMISILRACMALPILYFLREGKGDIALIFILIAIVSDVLDGWLARISNEITDIGKILDPVADKVVIFSVMLYLMFADRMPAYFFLLLAVRDLTIVLMGVYLLNNCKIAPYSNKLGKIAVTFTSATVLAFVYSDIAHNWVLPIMWISIFFLLISWVQYCHFFVSEITRAKKKTAVSERSSKLSKGLKKTESSIASRIPLLGKYFRIDCDMLTSIEETLVASDLGLDLTDILIDRLKNVDRREAEKLEDILKSEMKSLIKTGEDIPDTDAKPRVMLFVGVNGTGKTTSIGKLARKFTSEGKKALIIAADTFRAAAYDQLKVWADRADADFMGNPKGKDPSSFAYDAIKSALAKGGIVLAIHHKLNIPIRYLGVGEQIDDLIEFDPNSFVDALLSNDN